MRAPNPEKELLFLIFKNPHKIYSPYSLHLSNLINIIIENS